MLLPIHEQLCLWNGNWYCNEQGNGYDQERVNTAPEIRVDKRCMVETNNFKYIGATVNEEITPDVEICIAIAIGHLAKLNKL